MTDAETQSQPSSLVMIDYSNYHYALRKRGWKIDWGKFKIFCQNRFGDCQFFYYEGMLTSRHFFDQNRGSSHEDFRAKKKLKKEYFTNLKRRGFTVRTKPIHSVYDSANARFKHKCNFDVELTIDAMANVDSAECLVLCSGDGDFDRLLRYFKGRGRKTVLLADSERMHYGLVKTANQTIYLEDLRGQLELI